MDCEKSYFRTSLAPSPQFHNTIPWIKGASPESAVLRAPHETSIVSIYCEKTLTIVMIIFLFISDTRAHPLNPSLPDLYRGPAVNCLRIIILICPFSCRHPLIIRYFTPSIFHNLRYLNNNYTKHPAIKITALKRP